MKMQLKKNQYFSIEFLNITKEIFPNNSVFIFALFLFKFSGLIIFSNSLELFEDNNNTISICQIFRSFTYFGTMQRSNITLVTYEYILPFLYITLLLPNILWAILLYKCPSIPSQSNIGCRTAFVQLVFTPRFKSISKNYAIIYILIIFFSQHLIEYLMFPIVFFIPDAAFKDNALLSKIITIRNGLLVNKIVLISVNSIFVIIINAYLCYFFKFYNYPFLSHHYVNKFTFNNYFLVLLLIIFNFQGLHFLLDILFVAKYAFTITSFLLSIMLIFIAMNRFVESITYNFFLLSYVYFSLFSTITSLILHLTMKDQRDKIKGEIYFEKFLIQIAFMLLSHFGFIMLQDKRLNKVIKENILIKTKQIKGDYLFQLTYILKKCIQDNKQFSHLFNLIEDNRDKLTKGDSDQERLKLSSFFGKFKEQSKLEELNFDKKQLNFKEKYNNLIILIESEIISYITNLIRSKKILENMTIPLLHCDFIFYFKLNCSFSLYFIQEYLSKISGLSLESVIHFHSLKHIILEQRESKLRENQKNSSLHVKFSNFLNYFQSIQDIKFHLLKNCTDFQRIISLKNIFSEVNYNKESSQIFYNLEELFENCMKIDKSLNEIQTILIDKFTEFPLKNPEIVFLITNFYEITHQKVPQNIQNHIIDISSYDDVCQFDSAFLDQGFDHPILLTLSSLYSHDHRNMKGRSNFNIYYVSQKLMNALGYKESDLIGKDYNILLPKMFAEAHSVELKKVFFLNENFQINNNQFILSKEGYYVKIKETSGIIPSLKNDTIIISNIALDKIDKNSYLFITDINSNIVTISKNFEETFQLNYEMINRLRITFSNLFAVNNEKVKDDFSRILKSIDQMNFGSIESLMNIMNFNTYDNMLSAYETKELDSKAFTVKINKKKRKMIMPLQKIKKQIEEQEYDTDWLSRISCFEKICSTSLDNLDSSFDIFITLRNLGNCPYFVIKVFNKDEMCLNEIAANIAPTNKLSSIMESPQEDYLKKYYDNYQKASLNQSFFKKSQNTGYSANTSTTMNDTNQHLLLSTQKKPTQNIVIKPRTYIKKLNINPEKGKEIRNKLISQLKKREVVCSFFLFTFMTAICILFIINLFIKNSGIQLIQDTSTLIFNIVKVKQSIIESALLMTSACYQLDGLEPNPYDEVDFTQDMIKSQLFVRGSEMFKFYNEYMEYLKQYSYIAEINTQISTLIVEYSISKINEDFSIINYPSDFETELHYFHFNCGYLKTIDSLVECNVKDHFLGGVKNEGNHLASEDEFLFYYSTQNILIGFINALDKLIYQSSNFIHTTINDKGNQFFYFNLSILIVCIVLLITFACLVAIYKQRIASYINVFIVKSQKTIIMEKKLNNFRTLLISFDNEICEKYEMNKEILCNYKENNKDLNVSITLAEPKDKNNKNNKNDSKLQIEEMYQDNQFSINTSKLVSLTILKRALLLFLITLFISLSIMITNIVIDSNLLHTTLLTSETAFSYFDYIASINELLLYYRVSILYGDANFIKLPIKEYDSLLYQYNLANGYVNMDDERYTFLGESKMAFLFYRSNLEGNVISYFEASERVNILPLLKEYIKLINTEDKACEEFASAYTLYINDSNDLFDQEFLMFACMNLEGGNSNKGIQKQLGHFLTAVFDQYIDFAKNPNGDLAAYSQSTAFISSLKLMIFIYNVSWHICVKIVEQELKNLFAKIKVVEFIFQITELIMSVIFTLLYSVFVIAYLKLSINRFGIIIERLKITLND